MMNKSEVIKNLLSDKTNVQRVKDLILSQGEMQAASGWYPCNEDELEEYLIALPNEEFISMMNELGIDVHMASVSSKATPLPAQGHQNLQDPRGDVDLLAFSNEQPTDCDNIRLLPKPHSPGSGSECPQADHVSEAQIKLLKDENEQLKIKLKASEIEKETLRMELQKSQEKQQADSKCFIECKAKGQILENNNNLMSQQVSAMGRQLEELKWKKAQIENALELLQKESNEDKENHHLIANHFHKLMVERRKRIKELEAEIQVLKNTNPGNDCPVQLYELLMCVKEKNKEIEENCQELRNENESLKVDLRKKEDEIQMQQASQAALYAYLQEELARRLNEEVNKLHKVYEDLMEFARKRGFQWTGALNDESDDEGCQS